MSRKLVAYVLTAVGLAIIAAPASSKTQLQVAENKPAAPQAAAPPPSIRTESINFNAWSVTCQEAVGTGAKKTCVASLRVLSSDGRIVLLNWQIGYGRDRRMMSAFQVPLGLSVRDENQQATRGILVKDGLDIKIGASPVKRIGYSTCDLQVCEAALPLDEALTKLVSAASAVTVTAYAADGRPIPLSFDAKGVDKAIEAIRQAH